VIEVHHGDCLDVLRGMAAASVDAVVTDPPYHLKSITERFGKEGSAPVKGGEAGSDNPYRNVSRGFMGKTWDGGDIAQRPEMWAEVLRVMKPGAHLVAFGGTRTYHRMACAIEDAGFEIRDQLAWMYGSGFPKSLNVGRAMDPRTDADIEAGVPQSPESEAWNGWGTALKPAHEPIVLARKPLSEPTVAANVARWGTGALNVDGCRVATEDKLGGGGEKAESAGKFTNEGWRRPWMDDPAKSEAFAAKVRENVKRSEALGRWPANLVHDGSDEVLAAFAAFGERKTGDLKPYARQNRGGWAGPTPEQSTITHHGDTGTAARFFYSAKASKAERAGSKHPTVKPVALMRWLVRMVTPKGGTVLDSFAGSGTTGVAAQAEGMRAVLIEREAEYVADIKRRLAADAPLLNHVA
jgi:site-specific DNA-methyltransferase (adenine-specific)